MSQLADLSIQIFDCEQGTPEWFDCRKGIPTSSEFSTVMAKGKDGGASITRAKYMRQLAGEIHTGEPAPEGYTNAFMDRGHELENEARTLYAFMKDAEPRRVGFVKNGRAGCSPDSLIGERSGLEIKVAIPAVQIERLQRNDLPPEHKAQVQGSMWVTNRPTWEFMSYCPKMPPLLLTIQREDEYIANLVRSVTAFTEELDMMVAWLKQLQGRA